MSRSYRAPASGRGRVIHHRHWCLNPPFSCRAGHCGSCATRLAAGRVTYAEPTAWRLAEGEVLLCCAVPAAEGGERIELDL